VLLLLLLGADAARLPLFDVLLRVRRITCTRPHTRPQLDEHHDDFVAARRFSSGNGQCSIRSHGLEKVLHGWDFPSRVTDLDVDVVQWLEDMVFDPPMWQDGECLRGAGGGEGCGRLRQLRAAAACACA
jgi:hypothetical protein